MIKKFKFFNESNNYDSEINIIKDIIDDIEIDLNFSYEINGVNSVGQTEDDINKLGLSGGEKITFDKLQIFFTFDKYSKEKDFIKVISDYKEFKLSMLIGYGFKKDFLRIKKMNQNLVSGFKKTNLLKRIEELTQYKMTNVYFTPINNIKWGAKLFLEQST
jgi:hypothetical protein